MNEERFDPQRHTLDYAAQRLKVLAEKKYELPNIDNEPAIAASEVLVPAIDAEVSIHVATGSHVVAIPLFTSDDLRGFVREEVRAALAELIGGAKL